jgi:hypothetical protein
MDQEELGLAAQRHAIPEQSDDPSALVITRAARPAIRDPSVSIQRREVQSDRDISRS